MDISQHSIMIMPNTGIMGIFKVAVLYFFTEAFPKTYRGGSQSLDQSLSLIDTHKPLLQFYKLTLADLNKSGDDDGDKSKDFSVSKYILHTCAPLNIGTIYKC